MAISTAKSLSVERICHTHTSDHIMRERKRARDRERERERDKRDSIELFGRSTATERG